jgi:hypothetical protein
MQFLALSARCFARPLRSEFFISVRRMQRPLVWESKITHLVLCFGLKKPFGIRLNCTDAIHEVCFMTSRALRAALIIVAAFVLVGIMWVWLTLNWSYSEGERAGYVQKLSSKGWLCKTWEGEIAMVTMPGAIPEKFDFTVRDTAVASKINDVAGKRVVLSYQQHKFIPSSCFGETEYFVTAVREVSDQPLALPAAPQGQLQVPR